MNQLCENPYSYKYLLTCLPGQYNCDWNSLSSLQGTIRLLEKNEGKLREFSSRIQMKEQPYNIAIKLKS